MYCHGDPEISVVQGCIDNEQRNDLQGAVTLPVIQQLILISTCARLEVQS
jgi:hypothetical protein